MILARLFALARKQIKNKTRQIYFSRGILNQCNALWVKSGNRGSLKCLQVNDNFVLIFYRKFLISFLRNNLIFLDFAYKELIFYGLELNLSQGPRGKIKGFE